jgi:hypothetical protein
MKNWRSLRSISTMLLAGTCLSAAATSPGGPVTAPAGTNAAPAAAAIPQSVFVIPTSREEGRDPFFPKSDRVLGGGEPVKGNAPAAPVFTVVLNGLSGPEGHRLAMINGRTLAEGEDSDFATASGHTHVRCLAIHADSVLVEVAGERRELHFRQSR